MSVQVLAQTAGAANSAAIAVADGSSITFMLDGDVRGDSRANVQLQTDDGLWTNFGELKRSTPTFHAQGPGVFRIEKPASSSSFGVDRADATPLAAPVNTVAPAITGTPTTGSTLTCSTGTWTSPATTTTYAYQWKRAGVNIAGQTAATHLLVLADEGTAITCSVTATNPAGSASQVSNTVNPTA